MISPVQLMEMPSELSDKSNQKFLLPPKVKSSRERTSPLDTSLQAHVIEEDRADRLETECECLKKLLRAEMDQNRSSQNIIDKLVKVLESSAPTGIT
jgi:hypothetical protein